MENLCDKKNFFKTFDLEADKVKREVYRVELRKAERLKNFERKRGEIDPERFFALLDLPEILSITAKLTDVEKLLLCKEILINRGMFRYEVLKFLSRNLDLYREDFIPMLVSIGILEVLSEYLGPTEPEECVREASGILSGITYGPHEIIKLMFELDLVDKLLLLISNQSVEIAANAIWALSNIMCDNKDYWTFVVDHKFIWSISYFAGRSKRLNRVSKKAILGAVRSLALYAEDLFFDDFTSIFSLIKKINKTGFEWRTLEALSSLVTQPSGVQMFIQYKLVDDLMNCVESEGECGLAALKVLAKMNVEIETAPRMLIEKGVFERLEKNLVKNDAACVRHTLWAIDCLLVSSPVFRYSLMSNKILSKVVQHLLNPNERVRHECSFIVYNALEMGDRMVSEVFFQLETVSLILQSLIFPDPDYLKNVLISLQIICKHLGHELLAHEPFFSQLYKLEFHVNAEIKSLASSLLLDKLYFDDI